MQKSLSEVWAWWPLVANLVEAMVARFLTSVQSQFFSSDSEILQVSLTQTRLPFDCLLIAFCFESVGHSRDLDKLVPLSFRVQIFL